MYHGDDNLYIATNDRVFAILDLNNNNTDINQSDILINKIIKYENIFWSITSKGLYNSSDQGLNWEVANSEFANYDLRHMELYNDKLILGSWNSGLLIYDINSNIISQLNESYSTYRTYSLVINNDILYAGMENRNGGSTGLFEFDLKSNNVKLNDVFKNPNFPNSVAYPCFLTKNNSGDLLGLDNFTGGDVFVKPTNSNNFIRYKLDDSSSLPPLIFDGLINDKHIWVSYFGMSELYKIDIELVDTVRDLVTSVENNNDAKSFFNIINYQLVGNIFSEEFINSQIHIYNLQGSKVLSKQINLKYGYNPININLPTSHKPLFIEINNKIYKASL